MYHSASSIFNKLHFAIFIQSVNQINSNNFVRDVSLGILGVGVWGVALRVMIEKGCLTFRVFVPVGCGGVEQAKLAELVYVKAGC